MSRKGIQVLWVLWRYIDWWTVTEVDVNASFQDQEVLDCLNLKMKEVDSSETSVKI